jgi:hypothetical protein
MRRETIPFAWTVLHFVPLLLVPLVTHGLDEFIGINSAAALTHLIILVSIAIGETYLMRTILPRPHQWAWRTACGLAAAVIAGLVVMSTVDLQGYDALATLCGMTAAGLVFGLIQGPGQPLGVVRWIVPIIVGWLGGAILFRSVIVSLAALSLGGVAPWGLAYNAGHNELLWFAVGLACHGLATAWNIAALTKSAS